MLARQWHNMLFARYRGPWFCQPKIDERGRGHLPGSEDLEERKNS